MSNIPEEIKAQIENGVKQYLKETGTHDRPDITKHDFTNGVGFGYSLRDAEVLKLQEEVERLKAALHTVRSEAWDAGANAVKILLQTSFTDEKYLSKFEGREKVLIKNIGLVMDKFPNPGKETYLSQFK